MATDRAKRRVARELEAPVERARDLARRLGLSPLPVEYWVVDQSEMNELVAYDGFQTRYPHWRWGMKYERQRTERQYFGGKAFELVTNDVPAHAFLQESNAHADQKAVVTHVEAHADFFANSEWFPDDPDAAATLERHARTVSDYVARPDLDREDVERWLDHALCLRDNVDQHAGVEARPDEAGGDETADGDPLAALDLSEEVRGQVLGDVDDPAEREEQPFPPDPVHDLLGFLLRHGKRHDAETGKAVEMADWQTSVLDIVRREAHYFAPQRLTKVMNEGWAAYWESVMMGEEAFADADEFVSYADHQSRVLNSPGFNPYKLGKELWEYVENTANRRAVVERLLRVEGVTWRNFHDVVDVPGVLDHLDADDAVASVTPDDLATLDPDDPRIDADALSRARDGEVDVSRYPWAVLTTAGLAERHFSLCKPRFRGFLGSVSRTELERTARYLFDDERYPDVEAALADVDYGAGWDRMRTVRGSHNDVTFIDEFLTQEFVDDNDYFAYEFSRARGDYRATSTDAADVKRKLLLQRANFGKPRIAVYDANHENRNELLLGHDYNGVQLDVEQAGEVLERVFELWGRPVNLDTVVKHVDETTLANANRRDAEPVPEERGLRLRYDGESLERIELDWSAVEHLAATDLDYDTRPDDWLG
jgi:stage V sporulation protein R